MSRKVIDNAIQTDAIKPDTEMLMCPVFMELFFDPIVSVPCGHIIESEAKGKLASPSRCPYCSGSISTWISCPPILKGILESHLKQALLFRDANNQPIVTHNDIHFNMNQFAKIVNQKKVVNDKGKTIQEEGLKTPLGQRYIELLENASIHLNNKATEGTYIGESPIQILCNTQLGRDLVRKKLKIESILEKYFFGNAEISAESLQTLINGKSIREWLSITTAMEIVLDEEQNPRQEIDVEAQTTYRQLQEEFSLARFFLLRDVRDTASTDHRIYSNVVNSILQQVVNGNEDAVKVELEKIKGNSVQLTALLSATGKVRDYSDRMIIGMTPLQAAAAAGDINMCLILRNHMSSEEVATQLAEIFPDGIEAHEAKQKRETFNFDAIFAAIHAADHDDVVVALRKIDNGSALCHALEKFRLQFAEISHHEKIFNPHHLLRAAEVYTALWDKRTIYLSDPYGHATYKCGLFWRQIIGYVQRFIPACYAQAFSQGLYYLVRVNQNDSWRPEIFKRDLRLRHRDLTFRHRDFSYFPLPDDARSGLGFDFAIYITAEVEYYGDWRGKGERVGIFFQKLSSGKNIKLGRLIAPTKSHQSHINPGCSVM